MFTLVLKEKQLFIFSFFFKVKNYLFLKGPQLFKSAQIQNTVDHFLRKCEINLDYITQ